MLRFFARDFAMEKASLKTLVKTREHWQSLSLWVTVSSMFGVMLTVISIMPSSEFLRKVRYWNSDKVDGRSQTSGWAIHPQRDWQPQISIALDTSRVRCCTFLLCLPSSSIGCVLLICGMFCLFRIFVVLSAQSSHVMKWKPEWIIFSELSQLRASTFLSIAHRSFLYLLPAQKNHVVDTVLFQCFRKSRDNLRLNKDLDHQTSWLSTIIHWAFSCLLA